MGASEWIKAVASIFLVVIQLFTIMHSYQQQAKKTCNGVTEWLKQKRVTPLNAGKEAGKSDMLLVRMKNGTTALENI